MKPSENPQEGRKRGLDSTIPTRPIHNPCLKNVGNLKSFRLAINAMCANCMGCTVDHREPGFVDSIRQCKSVACPLWSFRPFKSEQNPLEGGVV